MRRQALRAELPALLHLALPLIAAELGWMAMSVVDTVMVGRLPHSAVAMAGAALSQVSFNVLTFATGGVLLGLDTLLSQEFGARQVPEANRWLLHGVVLALALAAALAGVLLLAPAMLLRLPVEPQILAIAVPALRGLIWGVPPLLLYFTLRRYLQAAGHGRPIAFALISANAINAAGDWLLLYGHRWGRIAIPAFGVTGSSWSTSFARLYMMLVLLAAVLFTDRRHAYGLASAAREHLRRRLEVHRLRRLLQLGVPAGAQIFVEIAIFALVTTLIATFGPLSLAGHEIALQCASTTFMVPFAISAATAVRVGHNVGRMREGRGTSAGAVAAGWTGILAGAAFMLLASGLFLLMPAKIAHIFTPNAGVVAAAVPLLYIAAGFQFFDGIQITATGAMRGASNTTAPFYTQLVCFWAVGMPLGMLLGFREHMGAAGLWWGLLIALTAAALALLYFWRRTCRRLPA